MTRLERRSPDGGFPRLRPGLVLLWRGERTAQLGVSPARALVLDGLTDAQAAVLRRLDRAGHGGVHVDVLVAHALAYGGDRGEVGELLGALERAGALQRSPSDRATLGELPLRERDRLRPDAAAWDLAYDEPGDGLGLLAARARRVVVVAGAGRVAAAVVGALRSAGVGRATSAPTADTALEDPAAAPDLVVLAPGRRVDLRSTDGLLRAGVPHLAVTVDAERAVIGPLVRPGQGPCLRCLDLARADRDPSWAALHAQLAQGRRGGSSGDTGETAECALAVLAAGTAALQVLTVLDGRRTPLTAGGTLELTLPDGCVEHRRWAAHPACGCGWAAGADPLVADRSGARVAGRREWTS